MLSAALATALFGLMSSTDPALLAPGPDDFTRVLDRANRLLVEAEAIGRAVERLHNRWAELAATARFKTACDNEETRSIAARTRVLGVAHRDAVQAARAQGRRLERVASAPTVVPAVDALVQQQADELRGRILSQTRRWYEQRAWQHRYIELDVRGCASKIVLAVSPGLPPTAPCVGSECGNEPVAIIAIGGGLVCPSARAAKSSVVISLDGLACYGANDCACVPVPVLPGAVLGP